MRFASLLLALPFVGSVLGAPVEITEREVYERDLLSAVHHLRVTVDNLCPLSSGSTPDNFANVFSQIDAALDSTLAQAGINNNLVGLINVGNLGPFNPTQTVSNPGQLVADLQTIAGDINSLLQFYGRLNGNGSVNADPLVAEVQNDLNCLLAGLSLTVEGLYPQLSGLLSNAGINLGGLLNGATGGSGGLLGGVTGGSGSGSGGSGGLLGGVLGKGTGLLGGGVPTSTQEPELGVATGEAEELGKLPTPATSSSTSVAASSHIQYPAAGSEDSARIIEDLRARIAHLELALSRALSTRPLDPPSHSPPSPLDASYPSARSTLARHSQTIHRHTSHTPCSSATSKFQTAQYSPSLPVYSAPLPPIPAAISPSKQYYERPRQYRELFSLPPTPIAKTQGWPEEWPVFWEGGDPTGMETRKSSETTVPRQ